MFKLQSCETCKHYQLHLCPGVAAFALLMILICSTRVISQKLLSYPVGLTLLDFVHAAILS